MILLALSDFPRKGRSAIQLQSRETENNKNRGGSASGNPMLATPNPRSNCEGEDGCIRSAAVDAEKQENRGGQRGVSIG